MKKKHAILTVLILILSLAHLLLSIYYVRLYAYFNVMDQLRTFVLTVQLCRLGVYVLILFSGYQAIKDQQKKLLIFNLAFFAFNLLLPFLFALN